MLGWLPFIVGFSTPQYSRNDFELVIRASKELEWLLDTHFGAYGKGLHEKVCACCNTHAAWGEGCAPRLGALSRGWVLCWLQASSVPALPPALVKDIRCVVCLRSIQPATV